MIGVPWFSIFTLLTETLVTAGVLYIFYTAYYTGIFPRILTAVVLSYEVLFNISYMVSRVSVQAQAAASDTPLEIALAIFHGTFSLVMFLLLLVYMTLAWRRYASGANFFLEHRTLTISFLVAWMIAILSGYAFFCISYL